MYYIAFVISIQSIYRYFPFKLTSKYFVLQLKFLCLLFLSKWFQSILYCNFNFYCFFWYMCYAINLKMIHSVFKVVIPVYFPFNFPCLKIKTHSLKMQLFMLENVVSKIGRAIYRKRDLVTDKVKLKTCEQFCISRHTGNTHLEIFRIFYNKIKTIQFI